MQTHRTWSMISCTLTDVDGAPHSGTGSTGSREAQGGVGESDGQSGGCPPGSGEFSAVESSDGMVISDARETCDGACAALSASS